jgi:hypothetical protein
MRETFISSFLEDEQDFDRYLADFKDSPAGDVFREHGSGFDSIEVVNEEFKSRSEGHSQAYWHGVKLL